MSALAPSLRRALEHNADRAATRAMRGDVVPFAALGRAPAARARVPGSVGAPLPRDLRAWLERSYDADLAEVRLHTGDAAARATQERGTEAFAAGRDVFVGASPHALHAERGRRVVAHEVAHVLQQTGRRGNDGKVRATSLDGDAPPQHADDEFVDFATAYKLFDSTAPTWQAVREEYQKRATTAAAIAEIDPLMNPSLDKANAAEAIAKSYGASTSRTDDEASLYVDALKLVAGYAQADKILRDRSTLETMWRSKAMYQQLRKGLGWMYKVASTHPFLKSYYPWKMIRAYRTAFFAPAAYPPELDQGDVPLAVAPANTFDKTILAALNGRLGTARPPTGANELEVATLFAFYYFDRSRRDYFRNYTKTQNADFLAVHRAVLKEFSTKRWSDLTPSPTLPEVTALWSSLFDEVKKAADEALAFWDRIQALIDAFGNGTGLDKLTADDVKRIGAAIPALPVAADLPKVLVGVANAIMVRPKNGVPAPDAFAAAIASQRAAVLALAQKISAEIGASPPTGVSASDAILTRGMAVFLLALTDAALATYNLERDRAFEAVHLTDVRDATRIRLAVRFLRWGDRLSWPELVRLSANVFREGPRLAVLEPFGPDPETDDKKQNEKFASEMGNSIAGFEGLGISGGLLAKFWWGNYQLALAKAFDDAIAGRLQGIKGAGMAVRLAKIEAASSPRPARWLTKRWEWSHPAFVWSKAEWELHKQRMRDLKLAEDPFEFSAALESNPYAGAVTTDSGWSRLIPTTPPPRGSELYFWVVPEWRTLAARLGKLAIVRASLAAMAAAKKQTWTPPSPDDGAAWMEQLEALSIWLRTDKDNKAKLDALAKAIIDEVNTSAAAAQLSANEAGRRASNQDRRDLVTGVWRPFLAKYDRSETPTSWAVQRIAEMGDFIRGVYPDEDRSLQAAALGHELAPWLDLAFGPKAGVISIFDDDVVDRYSIINPILQLLVTAERVWDQAENDRLATQPTAPTENRVSAVSWETKGTLDYSHLVVTSLRKAMESYVVREQKKTGLRTNDQNKIGSVFWDSKNTIGNPISAFVKHFEFGAGEGFQLYGYEYVIGEVQQKNWVFHPGFRQDLMGVPSDGRPRPGDPLLLNLDGSLKQASGQVLFTYARRKPGGEFETPIDVKDDDIGELSKFLDLLDTSLGFAYIAAGGDLIQAHLEFLLEAIDFLPGVAPVRLVLGILSLLTDPMILDVLDAFRKDGFEGIKKLFETLVKVIDFDELIDYLIFDTDFKDTTKNHPALNNTKTERADKMTTRGGVWARIGRILRNVIEMGKRVFEAFKRVVRFVQAPIRRAQIWTFQHPYAMLLVSLVEEYGAILASITLSTLEELGQDTTEANFETTVRTALTEAAQSYLDTGRDSLQALEHLELPDEIVPLEWLIDFVIDLAMSRLGAKYKTPAKLGRLMLQKLKLWDRMTKALGDKLRVEGVDPNRLYQDAVKKNLEPWFEKVRDGFTKDLREFLAKIPLLDQLNQPTGEKIDLTLGGLGFAEKTPATGDAPAVPPSGPLPTPSGGMPLEPSLRARNESAFGHDLRHVRIHEGSDAAAMTSALHADGVTSGSHVYVRPGLSLDEPRGEHVLGHELGHVLQQTGPRPLGQPHDPSPRAGEPGRGLVYDHAREAAADHAAERTASSQPASAPLDVGGRTAGVQPSFGWTFLRKFLIHLQEEEAIKKRGKNASRGAALMGFDQKAIGLINDTDQKVTPKLKDAIAALAAKDVSPPFDSIHAQILALAKAKWPDVERSMKSVLARSVVILRTSTKSKDAPPDQASTDNIDTIITPRIAPRNLEVELEDELLAATGIPFDVQLHRQPAPKPHAKQKEIVDLANPIKALKVPWVHPPFFPEDPTAEAIWDKLVDNTFGTTLTPARRAAIKAATKIVMTRVGYSAGAYLKTTFSLSSGKRKTIEGQADRLEEIKKDFWPTSDVYVRNSSSGLTGRSQYVGLRLGFYDDWGPNRSFAKVPDRDAHHIIQYLLIEYLYNAKPSYLPFPYLDSTPYPGIGDDGLGHAKTLGGGAASIAPFFPRRGGPMPTLFISRHAHQSNIHFYSAADDADDSSPSQGFEMHRTFKRHMGDLQPVLENKAMLKALGKNEKAGKPSDNVAPPGKPVASVGTVSDRILYAARQSYKTMSDVMRPELDRALHVQEVHYYNEVAKLNNVASEMSSDQATYVFESARTWVQDKLGSPSGLNP